MEIDNQKVLISAIIVALVVLVSFNFEKITGQATATTTCEKVEAGYKKSITQDIVVSSGISKGSTIDITVTPKNRGNVLNLGGQEKLWLKGPGLTREITRYTCMEGYTDECTIAVASTNIGSNSRSGKYCLRIMDSKNRLIKGEYTFDL